MLTGQKNLTTFIPSPEYCRRHISEDAVQYCVYLSEHLQIYLLDFLQSIYELGIMWDGFLVT